MCGIAGMVSKGARVRNAVLNGFSDALAHRGPDGKGVIRERAGGEKIVGLAHRRLSIIDLSEAGAQPMHDPETGNWVTFNGEMYNYKDIRKELEGKGKVFHSGSDTEVLLRAYEVYGEACLKKLRGMFAFALWDADREKLFGAVDRFGIKPLYYTHRAGVFAFASELRALTAAGAVPRAVNKNAVASFFAYGSVQAPLTMIEGVSSLLPAHAFVYTPKQDDLHIFQYWTVPLRHPSKKSTEADVHGAIRRSVRAHLESDVPLGLFLSGGVDSSSLAILAHEAEADVHAFNITFKEDAFAEGKYARQIGEKYCSSYTEIRLSQEEVRAEIPDVLCSMDTPSIDGVNAYCISKCVRDAGMKAVLSGQGGDEVFGGYDSFQRLPKAFKAVRALRHLSPGTRAFLGASSLRVLEKGVRAGKIAQMISELHTELDAYNLTRQVFAPSAIARLLPDLQTRNTNGRTKSASEWLRHETSGLDSWSTVSLLEMRGYLASTLLRDGDVMSMAHGLEVRVPFVDHEIVEAMFRLPQKYKVSRTLPKPVLLRSVLDRMPKEVYDRKKMGFTFPWEVWLRDAMRSDIEEVFQDKGAASEVGLSLVEVQNIWKRFLRNDPTVTWPRVWAPYVLLRWVREHIL